MKTEIDDNPWTLLILSRARVAEDAMQRIIDVVCDADSVGLDRQYIERQVEVVRSQMAKLMLDVGGLVEWLLARLVEPKQAF